MTDDDERELHRLCDMLQEVDKCLDPDSPLRESVRKGALGLTIAFMHGHRVKIEEMALGVGQPLNEAERAFLNSIGFKPDVP